MNNEFFNKKLKLKIWLTTVISEALLVIFWGYLIFVGGDISRHLSVILTFIISLFLATAGCVYALYRLYDYATQKILVWAKTGEGIIDAYMEALKFPVRYTLFTALCYYSLMAFLMLVMSLIRVGSWIVFNIFVLAFLVVTPGILIAYFVSYQYFRPLTLKLFELSNIKSLSEIGSPAKFSVRTKILITYVLISTNSIISLSGFIFYAIYNLTSRGVPSNFAVIKLFVIVFFNLLFTLSFAYVLSDYISDSLIQIDANLRRIATSRKGTLKKVSVLTLDEIGEMSGVFNGFLDDMGSLIKSIRDISQKISEISVFLNDAHLEVQTTVQEVSAFLRSISEGAFRQMDNVSKIFTLSEEINQDTLDVASVCEGLGNVLDEIADITEESGKDAEESLKNILVLSELTEDTINSMRKLGSNLEEVALIAESIKSISLQTNLLALNAAIESARVGEEGEGFREISHEIRVLNDDTNDAVIKIGELIGDIRNSNNDAIEQIFEVAENVRESKETISAFNRVLKEITKAIAESKRTVNKIITRSDVQKAGLEEILTFIQMTSVISQSNAASTEEVSANFQVQFSSVEDLIEIGKKLSKYAKELQTLMDRFSV